MEVDPGLMMRSFMVRGNYPLPPPASSIPHGFPHKGRGGKGGSLKGIVFYIGNQENRFAERNAWSAVGARQLGQLGTTFQGRPGGQLRARREESEWDAGGEKKTNRTKVDKGCGREVGEGNLQEYLECRCADLNGLEGEGIYIEKHENRFADRNAWRAGEKETTWTTRDNF